MNDRKSLSVRLARQAQKVPLSWLRIIEKLLLEREGRASPGPIVLLALPRSGSTLTYQLLCHALHTVYLCNLSHLLYQVPLLAGKLSRFLCREYVSDFRSQQGFVPGLCGPAEGLTFWTYWLKNGLRDSDLNDHSQIALSTRATYLKRVYNTLGSPECPVVTGYLGHALVWPYLRELFPGAIFLRLHRNPLDNAMSILRSRQQQPGDWFSVRPYECEKYTHCSLYEQAAAQVYWLNRRLDAVDNERTLHIGYESLCDDPDAILGSIIDFCNERGFRLTQRQAVPENFPIRKNTEDDPDLSVLKGSLLSLEKEHGAMRKFNAI